MKYIIMSCMLFFLFTSEQDIIKPNWVENVDSLVIEYNEDLRVEREKNIKENNFIRNIKLYEPSSNGISKMVIFDNIIENDMYFNQELYFFESKLIFIDTKGFGPIIYKRKKKKSEPCCSIGEDKRYFKSKNEAKYYKRELELSSLDSLKSKESSFENLIFEEYEIINTKQDYEWELESFERFKEQLFK